MKLTLEGSNQTLVAWFEPGDKCELRLSLSPGLSILSIRPYLVGLGWKAVDGEQTHFDNDSVVTSYLFTRSWNGSNQTRTRTQALAMIQAIGVSQMMRLENLDKVTEYKGRKKVAASAPIGQLPGM